MRRHLGWALPLRLTLGLLLAVSCGEALHEESPATAGRGAGGAPGGAAGAPAQKGSGGALGGSSGNGSGAAGAGGVAGAPPEPVEPAADDWRRKTIYLALADRFFDGDSTNNKRPGLGPADVDECFDPAAPLLHHGGDLAGFSAKIGYLSSLGIGALWSTPLYQQQGARRGNQCAYHGYWADFRDPDDGALEPRLGTAAEFTALLGGLHGAGISFMIDLIVNHAGYEATITGQHPDWFNSPPAGCNEPATYDPIHCPLSGLPDFDQRKPEVAAYLSNVTASWLTRFPIDGIRLDTAKHIEPAYLSGGWVPTVRAARPGLFLLAEVFDGSGPEVYRPFLDAGFDATFHFALRDALRRSFALGESTDALASAVDATQRSLGAERAQRLVSFLDNHDVPRFLSEMPAGLPAGERVRRLHLALAALFTLPGIPQLYAGTELGAEGTNEGASHDNRRSMPPWAWTPEGRAGEHPGYVGDAQRTFAHVQKLTALRSANPALFAGSYTELWRPNQAADLYAFVRGWSRRSVFVIINNGATAIGPTALPFHPNPGVAPTDRSALPDGTELVDLLGEGAPASLRIENGAITASMPPKTVGIYRAPD
ncbi:MAG: alpha-amylase family glycosyl hydrolase [Polyangiaceae bacterium]|nr:alpha-amylase family glycosyl hydrolase [Polyangiaceae bacterium]